MGKSQNCLILATVLSDQQYTDASGLTFAQEF